MENLHFLQPLWLLALIPLALLWWLSAQTRSGDTKAWSKVIDANLLPLLLGGSDDNQTSGSLAKWLLAIGWFIAIIALANPVWEKIPRPIFQTNTARVIVLDLSSSMLINDLKPSRLARARFKIEDILSEQFTKKEEGQVGLVLFAGDAFTASPLTRDSETIRALLQVLTPKIMPLQGSRVDLGLQRAHELLTQAGVDKGEVLLIADGVSDQNATLKIVTSLKNSGHRLSVLGVGTELGGTLPNLKYRDGKKITVKLESTILNKIAQLGGGNYHLISTNNSDLKSVLSKPFRPNSTNNLQDKNEEQKTDDWKSTGPFIILLLLPFAALAFRRGWLLSIAMVVSLAGMLQPQPVFAAPSTTKSTQTSLKKVWENIWNNQEQLAENALHNKQYDKAISLSNNPLRRGTAEYKKGNYEEAIKSFKQAEGAVAKYNEGNALVKLKKYQEALEAYDEALEIANDTHQEKKLKTPIVEMEPIRDALLNKMQVEQFLKQEKHKKSDKNKDDANKKEKEGKQSENGKKSGKGKEKKQDGKKGKKGEKQGGSDGEKSDDNNQFSDANKELDKEQNKSPEEKQTKADNNKEKQKSEKSTNNNSKDKGEKSDNPPVNAVKGEKNEDKKGTKAEAKELSKEEKMAAEQWLRRIPDDPGGLLRRKFQRQYQQRRRKLNNQEQPW